MKKTANETLVYILTILTYATILALFGAASAGACYLLAKVISRCFLFMMNRMLVFKVWSFMMLGATLITTGLSIAKWGDDDEDNNKR